MPEISVIMPVYNAEQYLRQAIDSILDQTFTDFELLLLNDASTDGSENIILSYRDDRIRYYRNEKNLGLIQTLNKGIDLCTGEFIARMDNDDISLPGRFEIQLRSLKEDQQAAMICSPILGITSSGKKRDHWPADINTLTPESIRQTLPWENCIVHPTVMIRAGILRKYRYSPEQKGSEDWDLWLRMSRDGLKIIKTKEVLLHYRIHGSSMTVSHNRIQSAQIKSAFVKARFALKSILSGRFNSFVLKTAFTINKDLGFEVKRKRLPSLARQVKRLTTLSPFISSRQFDQLEAVLRGYKGRYFLFFPYSHLGGAEKVHGQITRAIEDQDPLVFFTGIHNSDDYRSPFGSRATLINIAAALYHPIFAKRTQQLIIKKINSHISPVVFGCNNQFFYDMLPALRPEILVADLTHDISYENNRFAEEHLPNYLRCNTRVFISSKALERTQAFYEKNFVEDEFTNRLQLIYNCVDLPAVSAEKEWRLPLTVLYTGRDTSEKRVQILLNVAKASAKAQLPLQFVFVGPITPPEDFPKQSCFFKGVVTHAKDLAEIYSRSHFIAISSSSEGFPLSVMEGMQNGCIPVCTAVGDIPSHIKHGVNGYLVDPDRNVEENLLSLVAELTENLNSLQHISDECKRYAAEKFSRDKFVAAYRALLDAPIPE